LLTPFNKTKSLPMKKADRKAGYKVQGAGCRIERYRVALRRLRLAGTTCAASPAGASFISQNLPFCHIFSFGNNFAKKGDERRL
jgi:hypothetical protein